MAICSLIVALLFAQIHNSAATQIDNEIVGPLNVTCLQHSINLNFKTKHTFNGKVYVRGASDDPRCSADFTTNPRQDGVMVLPFTDCNMERERMPFGAGIMQVTTVIISFHPVFITKGDRAFRIECTYHDLDYLITAAMDVSKLTTEALKFDGPTPKCRYTLHRDNKEGPEVTYANVGDTVVHRWQCDTDMHAAFIHSCVVAGANKDEFRLIDESGCSIDDILVPNLNYEPDLTEAWVETMAFKFQDTNDVRFQCKLELCLRSQEDCLSNLPPICDSKNRRRYRRSEFSRTAIIESNDLRISDLPTSLPNAESQGFHEGYFETGASTHCISMFTIVLYSCLLLFACLISFICAYAFSNEFANGRLKFSRLLH